MKMKNTAKNMRERHCSSGGSCIFERSIKCVGAAIARIYEGFFNALLKYDGGFISVPEKGTPRKELTTDLATVSFFGHLSKTCVI